MRKYDLTSLEWVSGTDKNHIPYQEADASIWFDDEPVTIRKYSRNYVITYHGDSGVDDWTSDGNGDGYIRFGILVIVSRIPVEAFESDTTAWIKKLRPRVFDIGLEYGDEYV